ncbi:glycogen synthase GlgA [Elioraea sp. Yellowstone]|jgi:starch synthase|uniref:glycogen synthase GlgA n=1 Tax=Elioraea sp. Yellowstone TaxID=2592070 RepID=UPI001153DA12|nr:glycogen synthase GlgA [Elioraea sp. Yellowstone]TQF79154.1 glycogen synthase GlgA [Elioraea sp. Yellowstone]
MRVLAVASEAVPFVKTGGLADVVGALPAALAREGVAVTTLLPGYPAVLDALAGAEEVARFADLPGGPARLLRGQAGGLAVAALDAPALFDRPGNPYLGPDGADWPDNGIRFAALGAAAARLAAEGGFAALHAHDWQAGLAGAYLRHAGNRLPVLFTLHNLAFQGHFPAALFPHLGLPDAAFALAGVEFHGGVGFLKAGLWYADAITTVSPTYAAEITTPEGGMGLDGLLAGRAGVLHGILNGIDTTAWDPATDRHLAARFDAADPAPRAANRAALGRALGIAADPPRPLFGFVGRLTWQKGVDLILDALPALLATGGSLALLGSGEAGLEARARAAAAAHPGRVGVAIGYDERIARLIYAGADGVLVPSRFEPCGLAQLCALRYGAVPVVARLGGLADTVVDANPMALQAGWGTGLQFSPPTAGMLAAALRRAAALFADAGTWRRLQRNAMATDVSWTRSAAQYAALLSALARG